MGNKTLRAALCALGTILLLLFACFVEVVVGGTCYKDESLGDRDGNVYQCNSNALPRCCTQEGAYTCCMAESKKNLTEQLQLWGAVVGFLVFIGLLFVCCKNDISFCNSELSLKDRWNNFRNKNKNMEAHMVKKDEKIHGAYYDNPIGDYEGPSDYYPGLRDPYNFPNLPPSQKLKDYHDMNQSYA